MGVLRQLGRFVDNVIDLIIYAIAGLIASAIWAVGSLIEMATDILSWINGNLEDLLKADAKEINIVRGDALANFIKQNQATGQYTQISLSQLNEISTSVINVAMNGNTVVDDQMIISNGGLSSDTKSEFNDKPTLKIKIAV